MAQTVDRLYRIAFFVEGMHASGVDTSTRLQAQALRTLGHQVIIFSPWQATTTGLQPAETVQLAAMSVKLKSRIDLSYPLSWRLLRIFKEQPFDLIHVHTSTSVNLLAWQMATLYKLPIVYTYHTLSKEYLHYLGLSSEQMATLFTPMIELYDKMICDRADLVITPSAKAAAYLRNLGIQPAIRTAPNGVDVARFRPGQSTVLQTEFGVPSDATVLLFVGRLNQEKRPLLAYELFRHAAHAHPHLHLVMVGDGALRPVLAQRAQHDDLAQRVTLTGKVDYAQMPGIYNSAHLWISTSQSEVHPMAALEAAACGLPAVAFADPALTGIVEHGVSGWLVTENQAFLDGIAQLLDSPERYAMMQNAAVAQAQRYQIEASARLIVDCYHEAMASRAARTPENRRPRHRGRLAPLREFRR